MKNKGLFITLIIAAVVGIGAVVFYYSYDTSYITLVNKYNAQISENQVIYDEVWKVVQQQAQVSDQYAENFKEIYVQMMDARYESGGVAMKWIQEQNPLFSQDMYMKLMSTIESQRAKFTNVQRKLVATHQEITNLVTTAPSRFFVGGRPIPDLKIVTSTKTEAVFKSGKEDDVELFKK